VARSPAIVRPELKWVAGVVLTAMHIDLKSLAVGALAAALIALGYLYWERQRNSVEIRLPSISIEK
jgi:hypothetical protein